MPRLLGIDPGETTGVVLVELQDDDYRVVESREIAWARRFDNLVPFVGGLITGPDPLQVIVMESFILFPHRAQQQVGAFFPSVRVIGIVECVCFICNKDPDTFIVYQAPHNKTRVKVLDESLPASPHIRDAYRHVRYYIEKRRLAK